MGTGVSRSGLIKITRRLTWEQDGRPIPSEELLMPRESFLRKLVLRLSSLTLLLGSVLESSLLRTERRSLLLYPMTVVLTLWRKTTRCWFPDSVVKAMLLVTFPESDLRSVRSLTYPSMLSSEARKRGHALKLSCCTENIEQD